MWNMMAVATRPKETREVVKVRRTLSERAWMPGEEGWAGWQRGHAQDRWKVERYGDSVG